jgi:uncharacterized protein (DUF305 family)
VTSRRASVVGVLAGLVLVVGTLTGCTVSSAGSAGASSDGGGHDDADVAFATAMVPHHEQAIAMARLAADHAGAADIKVLARQIAAEQMPEIVQLQDLLSQWGRPAAPTASGLPARAGMAGMAGMNDATGTGQHMAGPGTMTDQQMRDLNAASGSAFDHLFLRMMIKHHGAGVVMARTELSDGEDPDARQIAQNISDSQQAQTTYMIQMLADT